MLTRCCYRVPLQPGCMAIGSHYLFVAFLLALNDIKTLTLLDKDKNDDKDNVEHRIHVHILTYVSLLFNLFHILAGSAIIYAAWRRLFTALKVFSTIIAIGTLFILYFFIFYLAHPLFVILLTMVLNLYFAFVLWSYAENLEVASYPKDIHPPLTLITHPPRTLETMPPHGSAPYGGPGTPGLRGLPCGGHRPPSTPVTPSRRPRPPDVHQNPGPSSALLEHSMTPPYSKPRSNAQKLCTPEQLR